MTAASVLEALSAASDDVARLSLLQRCSPREREALESELFYSQFMAETGAAARADMAAHEAFTAELAACADDAARLELFRAARIDRDEFVREWLWRSTATPNDWCQRYMAMINHEGAQ